MKCVMISIKPKWCGLIASGKKTIEVRKTKPKIELPFKCYIYCTKNKAKSDFFFTDEVRGDDYIPHLGNSSVVGEFVCDYIYHNISYDTANTCVSAYDLKEYANNGKPLYGWHISDLYKCLYLGYDKVCDIENLGQPLFRPPQSWCYCEEWSE